MLLDRPLALGADGEALVIISVGVCMCSHQRPDIVATFCSTLKVRAKPKGLCRVCLFNVFGAGGFHYSLCKDLVESARVGRERRRTRSNDGDAPHIRKKALPVSTRFSRYLTLVSAVAHNRHAVFKHPNCVGAAS
jgi:hypothetical protein